MMSDTLFHETELDDLVDFRNGKAIATEFYSESGRFPVFGSNGQIARTDQMLNPEPVIAVGRVGAYCGSVHYVAEPSWVTDNAIVAVPKAGNCMRFLYYLLGQLQLRRTAIGSAQPLITQGGLRGVRTMVPPLPTQRAIAHILGTLDDKIELNRRMNETLEGTARALFKSWFVDFDPVRAKADGRPPAALDPQTAALFPDGFEHTNDQLIPAGWRMANTSELFDVRDGTHASPKRKEEGFPLITSKHITGGLVDIENAYLISKEDFVEVNRRSKVETLDILITMIGTTGIPLLVHERKPVFAIKNIGLFKTSGATDLAYFFYLYLCEPDMQRFLESRQAGTTQRFLSLGVLRSIPVLVPPPPILSRFNDICRPMFEMRQANLRQSTTISALRDTLLPKLLSGELEIPDAEKFLEAAL